MSWTVSLLAAGDSGSAVLVTFLIYIMGVFFIAWASNRLLKGKNFLSEYFLGSRSLGVWAFALTLAATSSSGGSFMGFPSKIYTHGWSLGLWISSYMVVPICVMGILGKRINQVARLSGSITVPDILRDRFRSVAFGLIAVGLIVFFMTFNLVAQFKGGSEILRTLLRPIDFFGNAASSLPSWFTELSTQGSEYLLCLLVFGVAVIVYTTYGGFHAVVWTDVMQGIVMVVGVVIMLPLAIYQAGKAVQDTQPETAARATSKLESVTRRMATMIPPRKGTASFKLVDAGAADEQRALPSGSWIFLESEEGTPVRLFKIAKRYTLPSGSSSLLTEDKNGNGKLDKTEDKNDDGVLDKGEDANNNGQLDKSEDRNGNNVLDPEIWEIADPHDIIQVRQRIEQGKEADNLTGVFTISDIAVNDYAYGAKPAERGSYVSGPGPHRDKVNGFLPLSLAISFFFMWAISGTGQPSNMVRLMAFKDTPTLRRSIFTVAIYYSLIYFPLVIIFCCARVLIPGMESEPDRIMPQMAIELTQNVGLGWMAGLLIAAPFAAVMSTVDSFLLMISSGLVRDIYQRNLNPNASEKKLKKLSYLFTMLVGLGALLGAMNPPEFLQDIIVYTGSGLASCFLAAVVFSLFWPRSNSEGCIAAMLSGFGAHLSLYLIGFLRGTGFTPYSLWGMDPVVIGLLVSFLVGYLVTISTQPPPTDLVRKYFCKPTSEIN
jgi:sodium/pantothenate symporter